MLNGAIVIRKRDSLEADNRLLRLHRFPRWRNVCNVYCVKFAMPGENCAIFGCSTSQRHTGISIFEVPWLNNDFNKKWNHDLINITKDRQVDEPLKKRIASLYCEHHFSPEQIWNYPSREVLKDGALPSLNIPKRSISSSYTITRPTSIRKREEHLEFSTLSPPRYIYTDFQDFKNRIIKLSLNDLWQFELSENLVIATLKSTNHVLPKFEVLMGLWCSG